MKQKILIECLLLELHLGKFHAQRHWLAGSRLSEYRRFGLVTAIFASAIASSIVLELVPCSKYLAASFSLLATLINSLILQFKPEENMFGHKSTGSRFKNLARDARMLHHKLHSNTISVEQAVAILEKLHQQSDELKINSNTYHVGHDITKKVLDSIKDEENTLLQQLNQLRTSATT